MDLYEAQITGVPELIAGIKRLGDNLDHPALALRRMAEYYADRTKERVVQGGDPRYKDILPTSRARRKVNKTTPPLWDSGGLIEAITATRPGVADSLFAMTPDGFVAGTDAPGARRLQKGFKGRDSKGRKINQSGRDFLKVTAADTVGLKQIASEYVDELTEQFA